MSLACLHLGQITTTNSASLQFSLDKQPSQKSAGAEAGSLVSKRQPMAGRSVSAIKVGVPACCRRGGKIVYRPHKMKPTCAFVLATTRSFFGLSILGIL